MARKFKTADYAAMLKQTVSMEECLPATHLARFIAQSIGQLDLSSIYQEYGAKGGTPIAPEILLGLLLYGYATDPLDALPTIDAIAPQLGQPKRVALDSGYLSDANIAGFEARQIDPYLALGRQDPPSILAPAHGTTCHPSGPGC